MIFWQKKKDKVMGEICGGNPRKENDGYGVAVRHYTISFMCFILLYPHPHSHWG